MPRRSQRRFQGQFTGLDLNDSEYRSDGSSAIEALNVVIEAGRVEIRPGRVELAEDQLNPKTTIGLFNYTPPEATVRSLILVRPDGIYQRINDV